MPLSEYERRAWNQLERSLADGFPSAPGPARERNLRALAVALAFIRTVWPEVILMAGFVVLLTGALTHIPLIAITGLVVLCIGAHRTQGRSIQRRGADRRADGSQAFGPDDADKA